MSCDELSIGWKARRGLSLATFLERLVEQAADSLLPVWDVRFGTAKLIKALEEVSMQAERDRL